MRTFNFLLFALSLVAITILYLDLISVTDLLKGNIANYALAIGLLIPLSLLFFGYTQLRKPAFFFLWLLLSIGMLIFYFQFRNAQILQLKRGTALNSFKSLIGFLVVFQISRVIFIKLAGREYVTPSIGGRSDLIEGRNPQPADFFMFAILFFSIIAFQGV